MDNERISVAEHFLSDLPTEQMRGLKLNEWLEKHYTHDLVSAIQSAAGECAAPFDVDEVLKMMGITPVDTILASLLSAQLTCSGVVNYLEKTFYTLQHGNIVVTAQRVDGLTPAGKLAVAEEKIRQLTAELDKFCRGEPCQ